MLRAGRSGAVLLVVALACLAPGAMCGLEAAACPSGGAGGAVRLSFDPEVSGPLPPLSLPLSLRVPCPSLTLNPKPPPR